MSQEIDENLFKTLNHVLDKEHEQMLLTNLFDLHKLFDELKILLDPSSPNETIISQAAWPKTRREKLYYVNNLLTEWQSITKTLGIVYTPNSISAAYQLSKKLTKVKRDLKGGDGSESKHDPPHTESKAEERSPKKIPQNYRWSSRFVDPKKVHGLDAKAMSLERELVGSGSEACNSFKAIGIVGMPGIGKTTLAQLIFGRSKVKDYFLPRIWVSMSKQPDLKDNYDIKEVVERILRSLGVEEETITLTYEKCKLEGLIFTLRMQLKDKRYLIVLDDVEEDFGKLDSGSSVKNGEMMKKLEYGLPKGFGGTVIVTSRDDKVVKGMVGDENIHKMVPLSDPNSCWLIFKDWVQKDIKEFPSNLEGFRDEIMRKCGGLPLSAKLMGQIVNQRLKQRRTTNQQGLQPQLLQAENQQPPTENKPLTEQPLTENQHLTEKPLTEQQQLIEKLPMENQLMTEQPLKLQLAEKENQQPQPETEKTTEEPQPEDQQHIENQQLVELPETENQGSTEQPEKQQLTEMENQELTEQPEKPQLTETENQQPQPDQNDQLKEAQQPIENLQMETQQLAENQELTAQQEKPELTELETENHQTEKENDHPMEELQPIEKLQMDNQELTKLLQMETENQELMPQPEKSQLTETEVEDQPPLPENEQAAEDQQQTEKLQMENQELTEMENWELIEKPQSPEDPKTDNQQESEKQTKE